MLPAQPEGQYLIQICAHRDPSPSALFPSPLLRKLLPSPQQLRAQGRSQGIRRQARQIPELATAQGSLFSGSSVLAPSPISLQRPLPSAQEHGAPLEVRITGGTGKPWDT